MLYVVLFNRKIFCRRIEDTVEIWNFQNGELKMADTNVSYDPIWLEICV